MKSLTLYIVIILVAIPSVGLAAAYQSLISIPGTDANSFGSYINALYLLSISVAAILAVIKIIIGGVKYMLSDIVTNKSDAKNEIKGAVLGLLLIISAVLILEVINPNITKNTPFFGAKIEAPKPPTAQPVAGIQPTPNPGTPTPTPAPTPNPGTPAPTPTPTPGTPTPAPATCDPFITQRVSGSNTIFSQNLTGCTNTERSMQLQTFRDFCRQYNVFATGNGTISSCTVPTSRL